MNQTKEKPRWRYSTHYPTRTETKTPNHLATHGEVSLCCGGRVRVWYAKVGNDVKKLHVCQNCKRFARLADASGRPIPTDNSWEREQRRNKLLKGSPNDPHWNRKLKMHECCGSTTVWRHKTACTSVKEGKLPTAI